jgi:hypothetical protein
MSCRLRGYGVVLTGSQGAAALYLLDFDGTNLPNLKETIKKSYPDVHVRATLTSRPSVSTDH